ncbi:MAG TPA: hypothetical protein VG916_03690 [Gemmatimonadaceae bacterium]|nr:hypothetical protein [Gemmatimonadaceae bacterium]
MLVGSLAAALPHMSRARQQADASWQSGFSVSRSRLRDTGGNAYFRLEPGRQVTLEGGRTRLVITVLDTTERVDGVRTRVVEERETEAGSLVEVSRNYFAFNPADSAVYYFGEDVDTYRNGKIANHAGSWRSGVKGARFGLMMPAHPARGMRYYQEQARGVAMDRAEVVSTTDSVNTAMGVQRQCVRTEETSLLEPGTREYKQYCPGIGLTVDGDVRLVSVTRRNARPGRSGR